MANSKMQQRRNKAGRSQSPNQGNSSPVLTAEEVMQAAIRWGGFSLMDTDKQTGLPSAIVATAVAYAESDFNRTVYNGVCCDGLMQVHRGWRDGWGGNGTSLSQQLFGRVLSEAEWIEKMQQPRWNMVAAHSIWLAAGQKWGNPGGGGNPWEAFGNSKYEAGLVIAKRAAQNIVAGFDPDKLGEVNDITNLPGALGFAGAIASKLFGVTAEAFAKWTVGIVGGIGKFTWNELLKPQWEHSQKATIYYYENILTGKGDGFAASYAGLVTLTFWALGYAILWQDADEISTAAIVPERTAIGQGIARTQSAFAQRKLYKPAQVKKATPKKPAPKISKAKVVKVRAATVARKRQVRVGFEGEPQLSVVPEQEERTTSASRSA